MDARRLSETKSLLKKRNSMDRSKPMIEDAAHPGSANILRAISAGHFDLKHAETEHDGSAPMLEPGTGVHADIRPHVFQELSSSFSTRRSSRNSTICDFAMWLGVSVECASGSFVEGDVREPGRRHAEREA